MAKLRVLYVASEIDPFLATSTVARYVRALPQYMHAQGLEVRILMPRFGVINERKNNLHEVLRLSDTSLTIGEETKPLIIKVASIPQAKLQVYFIDSEDYFKRKAVFYDKQQQFFADNDARMAFFCRGVLETIKRLGWVPDVVHCHDWITSLIPMYLKTAYRHDPMFGGVPVVFTLYNNAFSHKFGADFIEKVKIAGLEEERILTSLPTADFSGLIQAGIQHADHVTRAEELDEAAFAGILDGKTPVAHIEPNEEGLATYHNLYQQLTQAS